MLVMIEHLHRVHHLRRPDGSECIGVEGPDGVVPAASLFLFELRHQSVNYRDGVARVIGLCEDWLRTLTVDAKSLAEGRTPSPGNIEALKAHLRAIGPKSIRDRIAAAMQDPHYRPRETVTDNVNAFRLLTAARYLESRGRSLIRDLTGNELLSANQAIGWISSAILAGKRRMHDRPRKGISHEEENALRETTRPGSPRNPLPPGRQEMLHLITRLQLKPGMRAAEPLLLKVEDVSPRGSMPTVSLIDRRNDPDDPRARRPSLKQAPRTLPIDEDLHSDICDYMEGTRAKILEDVKRNGTKTEKENGRKNQFLFIALNGRPISIPGAQKALRKLRLAPGLSADLCGARFRNTFADRYFEAHGADKRDELAYLTGRSPDSKQFHRYANAAIAKAASAAATFVRRRLRRR